MARISRKAAAPEISFSDHLILFHYFLDLFGHSKLSALAGDLNNGAFEGLNENQNTLFFEYLDRKIAAHPCKVSRDQLRQYDENICRWVKHIGAKRGGIKLKYFQYMALLFTEIYLDKYFADQKSFEDELNAFAQEQDLKLMGALNVSAYKPECMNKLAYMCATGSGKTLIMHVNILQFQHYLKRAKRSGKRVEINKIIVLAPNEGMSKQHLDELALSSIPAEMFMKDRGFVTQSKETVIVIDMNKLKEEGKQKTVSVDSFEQNNLVLVDEAHRGLTGDVWYDYRTRLSQDGGFAFEYSATFKQALRSTKANDKKNKEALDEYGKAIVMDYSYKFFYQDGYGKDYRIYNLRETIDAEQKALYLTGCLLSFYQQMKLYHTYRKEYAPFKIEKPLMVFVGNRVVTASKDEDLTDVEEVMLFIDNFVRNRTRSISRIKSVLDEDTGLIDGRGNELFYRDFVSLQEMANHHLDPADVFDDLLRIVFNTDTIADEPRLHVENLHQVDGEIGLRIGDQGDYFGVISIGNAAALVKNCEAKGIVTHTEEFMSESLFRAINQNESAINMLIGSRKFTEGWNSWRVSTMGLINFAKGEGSQAIQLFGRGVRLHGHHGCLKRSGKLDDRSVTIPKGITALETLTIFGVKAQYMEDFKLYLEIEELPTDKPLKYTLPVISRFKETQGKKLKVIRLPQGVNFKRQAARMLLSKPDEGFAQYLAKHQVIIDCRAKVQTIDSTFSMSFASTTLGHKLPDAAIPFLDYQRIFDELQQYKNEKSLYNLSLDVETLKEILTEAGWYELIIPAAHIAFDSPAKLSMFADFAISVLKVYIDKYCKYMREKWEAPKLAYAELTEEDNNFVDEYTFTYYPESNDSGEAIETFVNDLQQIINQNQGLDQYERSMSHDIITAFDFRNHLYAPLICLKSQGLKLTVAPVSLNHGEKQFVDMLRDYCLNHEAQLAGKSLYLLRNKSKVGMGFFEAGNFYPDYVLWIDCADKQLVTFIDPKGLMRIQSDDPKVTFYEKIKELEARLQPSSPDKRIILNSFIMSDTSSIDLRTWWGMTKEELEQRHVMCLSNSDAVDKMMQKLLALC